MKQLSTSQTTDVANIVQRVPEGFYQTNSATKAQGWPEDNGTWTHLLSVTHSNPNNYYAMQFAGGYFDNQDFYVRKVGGGKDDAGSAPWHKLWHDGNFNLLGKDIGINWRPYQQRLLIDKTQSQGDSQPALDIQVNAGPGILNASGSGVSSSFSVVGRAMPDTKHGHFSSIALLENQTVDNPGDPFSGQVAQASYVNQHNVNATAGWAIAAEVKEVHGQANPKNGSLAAEFTVIATGSDNNDKRCMIFLPANKMNPDDGILTEFSQGIYWKTQNKSIYKDANLFEGNYGNIFNAREVSAGRLINATGSYSGPVIDLGFVRQAGDDTAVQMNVAHHIRWTTADHQVAQRIGRRGNTMFIDGLPWSGTAGPQVGYVTIELNGTRLKIPCHLEA